MVKTLLSICKKLLVLLLVLIVLPINHVYADTISVTDKDSFLYAMNFANDGDIVKLENDIDLEAGSYGSGDCFSVPQNCLVTLDLNGKTINIGAGSASNNFGVGENSALLIKNGSIGNIDTNDNDKGVLILSGVTVNENICTGSTQIWIVNNSSVENILLVETGGTINPGAGENMNPITTPGVYENDKKYFGHENPAPAMVGSGVTWQCKNTLQEDFELANNDTTNTYTNIIFLRDSELENDASLTAGGININLGGYTLTTGDHILSIDNESGNGTNKIYSGTIDGDISMNNSLGEVVLSSLDVTGMIDNSYHPTIINSGHYNNITGGPGKITINDGFYYGKLVGLKYEISNGYFVNKPDPSYIIANKAAVKCNIEEKGITYNYTIGDHTHSWKYFANNNYLYAYCDADENCVYYGTEANLNSSVKLILDAPSKRSYSGNPIEATINHNNSNINSWRLFFNGLPTIEYEAKSGSSLLNNKPVNVGSYFASISIGENENKRTARVSFDITQNSPDNPEPHNSHKSSLAYIIPNTGVE